MFNEQTYFLKKKKKDFDWLHLIVKEGRKER